MANTATVAACSELEMANTATVAAHSEPEMPGTTAVDARSESEMPDTAAVDARSESASARRRAGALPGQLDAGEGAALAAVEEAEAAAVLVDDLA